MTAPIPEEQDQPPIETGTPPGEHRADLPDEHDAATPAHLPAEARENAETSLDEPSDGSGGE